MVCQKVLLSCDVHIVSLCGLHVPVMSVWGLHEVSVMFCLVNSYQPTNKTLKCGSGLLLC